jgi:Ca2+-binding EF-hand superfamily protein
MAAAVVLLPSLAQGQDSLPDPRQFLESHGGVLTTEDAKQLLHSQFSDIDVNHDGVISEAEFESFFMKKFQEADSDHDGRLTRAEMRAQVIKRLQARQASQQP